MKPVAFLEISSLMEPHWTGIPAVTAGLAEQAMADPAIDWRFFYGTLAVPGPVVRTLLAARDGSVLVSFMADHIWAGQDLDRAETAGATAVFTAAKTARRLFGREGLLVYDLSPLLTPQFHEAATIEHFASRLRDDVASSDHLFCISRATRDDVVHYFGTPPGRCSVVPMGISMDLADVSLAQEMGRDATVEPYVAVVGTLEPRKNGRMVLRFLAGDPGFARRFRTVFIGRDGWLDERQVLLGEMAAAGVSPDRVVFTGFVSEAEKVALLLNASFCVYASFFEGYGLPILEAATLGKLVVCSGSSSMPEVAPDHCVFFDPLSLDSLGRAMAVAEDATAVMRPASTLAEVADRIAARGWNHCYEAIGAWVRDGA